MDFSPIDGRELGLVSAGGQKEADMAIAAAKAAFPAWAALGPEGRLPYLERLGHIIEENVDAQIFSSTFDEPARRHAQVADLVIERAKRLVEMGKDVVLLLDSLTRLARGHNNSQSNGPIGSGGVNPQALQKSRKFFGSARNLVEGGSLTILATALIETESRMDEVIFEEFKGTGNMEIRLDQDLAERRIFPAIHIPQSGTRNDDRLYHPDELRMVQDFRKVLATLPVGDAVETALKALSQTQNNTELLLKGL